MPLQGTAWTRESRAAYLAAIVDGEGSVFTRKMNTERFPRPFVSVANTSDELATLLTEWVGGGVRMRPVALCEQGCSQEHPHVRRRGWQWDVQGERAAILLANLLPYMVIKHARAEQALDAWRERTGVSKGRMAAVRIDMQERGWEVGEIPPSHGEYRHYRAGCRCADCRAANAERSRLRTATPTTST